MKNETCGKKSSLKIIPEESTFIDAREIEIRDSSDNIIDPYEAPPNVYLKVVLIGDVAGISFTNEKYLFTGKFTTSELGKKLEYLLYADTVNKIHSFGSQRDKIKALKDLIKKLRKNILEKKEHHWKKCI